MLSGILTALLILNVFVLIVLITVFQHGNEGGIGSSLGGGNASGFFGASGGANVIVRATWIGGFTFFLLALSLAWLRTHESFGVSKEIDSLLEESATPSPAPDVGGAGTASPEASAVPASPAPTSPAASPTPASPAASPAP